METPRQDGPERPRKGAGAAKETNEAKERSVLIPLDAEDALRALARFAYSGDGDEDADDAPREGERR